MSSALRSPIDTVPSVARRARAPAWVAMFVLAGCGGAPNAEETHAAPMSVVPTSAGSSSSAASQVAAPVDEPLPSLGEELDASLAARVRSQLEAELDGWLGPFARGDEVVYAGAITLRDQAGRFPEAPLEVVGRFGGGQVAMFDRDATWHIDLYGPRVDPSLSAPLAFYAQRTRDRGLAQPRYILGRCAACTPIDDAPERLELHGAVFVGGTEEVDGMRTIVDATLTRVPPSELAADTVLTLLGHQDHVRAARILSSGERRSVDVEGQESALVAVPGEDRSCERLLDYRARFWVGATLAEREVRDFEVTRLSTRCCAFVDQGQRGCAPQRICEELP